MRPPPLIPRHRYVALFVLLAGLIASCLYLYSKADLFSATAFAGALSNATAGALINVTIPATMSNATVAISSLGSSAITHLTLITPEAPEDENERLLYTLGALVATIALVIYIVALALLREQISRCVALVREGTLVLRSMPFVSLYPLVGQAFVGAICVYAVVVGAFITSESETTWAQIHASLSPAANTSTTTADALSIFDALAPSDRYMLFISVHLFSVLCATAAHTVPARANASVLTSHFSACHVHCTLQVGCPVHPRVHVHDLRGRASDMVLRPRGRRALGHIKYLPVLRPCASRLGGSRREHQAPRIDGVRLPGRHDHLGCSPRPRVH